MSRRHRLFSEASARFERGVDYELPLRASAKAAAMLAELGGGTAVPGYSLAADAGRAGAIVIAADHPDRVAGMPTATGTVVRQAAGGRLRRSTRSTGARPAAASADGACRRPGGPT